MKRMSRRLLACALTVAMLVCCTISGLVLPTTAAEASTNLITNGDFENGKPGGGWLVDGKTAIVDGVGYNGSKGYKISANSGDVWCSASSLSLKVGATYIMRYITKGGATKIYFDANTSLFSSTFSLKKNFASEDWVQQTIVIKPTQDYSGYLGFNLYAETDDDDVYFDNFELYEYNVGMNLMSGSDGSALAGASATHLGNDSINDACDYMVFGGHLNAGVTMKVATDPDDVTNKVWEVSADGSAREMTLGFRGFSVTQYDIVKVSYRFKGKNGEVPTSNVYASMATLVKSVVTGPDANGWRTVTAWLNMKSKNLNYSCTIKFGSTNGMYVDDFSFYQTTQRATDETVNTIPAISAMQFAQTEVPMAPGSATLIYPQGKVGEIWDANAYCGDVTFASSDPSVATVEKNTGLVKMVSSTSGATATITATSSVTGAPTASYTVKMTIVEPTAIAMNKARVTLVGKGSTDTLSVIGTAPANAAVLPEKITWTSSDVSVATVDANGVVTAVYSGDKVKTATITAKYEGIDTPATATVTVDNNLLPNDVFAGITENTDSMTKYENGGYHNQSYITVVAGATYTFTVDLKYSLVAYKKHQLTAIIKGKSCEINTNITDQRTHITWSDTSSTAGNSWVEVYNSKGYCEPTTAAKTLTITVTNTSSDSVLTVSDIKLFELTEDVNLLTGGFGDLVGHTQKNFGVTTKKDSAGDEWFYIPQMGQYGDKFTNGIYKTTDLSQIYKYSMKYKPEDGKNGKFYANQTDYRHNGQVITSTLVGPDADGWYTYTAWIELMSAAPSIDYSTYFQATAPLFTKDWECYLVPKASEPIYGMDKVTTVGSTLVLDRTVWFTNYNVATEDQIPDADLEWSIADESVLAFDGSNQGKKVSLKAKALGTTTVTVTPIGDSAGKKVPVTISVKVLSNTLQTLGDYAVNFDVPNANVTLKDINGNALSSLITGAIIAVEVTPNNGYLPTPGTLRYVDADGTEHRLLNRTSLEGTVNSYMMKVPEGAFVLKNDMVSTAQNSFTAGTIATSYRELASEQGDAKVDGIRFLTRVYIEGLDLSGDKIMVTYNGTKYEVESMGTLLKRATNTTALTLNNVGGSGATTIWQVENYSKAEGKLSVSAYANNSLDFAATMTTKNPSDTFKDRKYTSRGYIKLEGLDEIIYTTPKTDSAADAQKRASGDLSTSSAQYGVKWSTTDADDLGTRCFDAEGLTATIGVGATAGYSDFDSIYPWSGMVRCNVKEGTNGEDIITYEGEPGFALDGSNGNVFVRIPKFSVQKYTEDGYEYRVITGDDTQLHPAFIEDGKVLDAIYVGAFEGYINKEEKLTSVGGVLPTCNVLPKDFLAAAQDSGVRYTLYDNRSVDALWTLVAVEYGCRNTNQVFGYGVADYMQPIESYINLNVRKSATATNEVAVKYYESDWYTRRYMPVNSTITICHENQRDILVQRKIIKVEDKEIDGEMYTVFTFDGDPVDLVASEFGVNENGEEIVTKTNHFIGSGALWTNYVEDAPSGGMTTWHTGRANWITKDAELQVTQNPIRYRWIENPVGNLWHYLPDVTFMPAGKVDGTPVSEMYTCSNMRDYDMYNADGVTYVSTGLTFENNYPDNGTEADKRGTNYWITSLIDEPGHVFGDAYDKELISTQAFGGIYQINAYDPSIIANGGGWDHGWKCNMMTNRGRITAGNKWHLYGARLMYKQIQE